MSIHFMQRLNGRYVYFIEHAITENHEGTHSGSMNSIITRHRTTPTCRMKNMFTGCFVSISIFFCSCKNKKYFRIPTSHLSETNNSEISNRTESVFSEMRMWRKYDRFACFPHLFTIPLLTYFCFFFAMLEPRRVSVIRAERLTLFSNREALPALILPFWRYIFIPSYFIHMYIRSFIKFVESIRTDPGRC